MAEGTYEYECMRAELLGLVKPNKKQFLERQKERLQAQEEEVEEKVLEEVDNQNENLTGASGKLDELNSILSVTQKKLNRFKTACGSLTNLLKIKVGQGSTESLQKETETCSIGNGINKEISIEVTTPDTTEALLNGERKIDLTKAINSQVDKLDALINKAETAQYSMAHQNKQMRSFLNK